MFHADLHPGNLMILPGNIVGYIDFGISGVLSRYSRRHLISMTLSYARGDLDAMCESFFRITTFDGKASKQGFRRGLKEVSVRWYGGHEGESRLRKSITSIMLELLLLSREHGIWPQRDVIKYIRSAIALDGLVKTFSPGMTNKANHGDVDIILRLYDLRREPVMRDARKFVTFDFCQRSHRPVNRQTLIFGIAACARMRERQPAFWRMRLPKPNFKA